MSTVVEIPVRSGAAMPPSGGSVAVASRLDSVDLLRGIIMVVMSLDHLREYLTYLTFTPENLSRTWPALFFTRWITHFCAPLFFFLAGTGAYLARSRGRSGAQLAHFLWTRGLWLVAVEFVVVDFGFTFQPGFVLGGVLWGLGWSMVVMAGLVRLPVRWLAAFGLALIFFHNMLDAIQPKAFGKIAWLWQLLHAPGVIPISKGFILPYVLVPLVGVMAVGYAFGALLGLPPERRRRAMWVIGSFAILLFVILRATNIYGNPVQTPFPGGGRFAPQTTVAMTIVSFLDVEKYPPSLQFLLMTLGPGILALAAFDRMKAAGNFVTRGFVAFGRVPFFYYVLHIYVAHILTIAIALLWHQPYKRIFNGGFMTSPPQPGYGHGLAFIYAVWIAMNIALYFPCRWFAEYKRTHRQWWLGYL